MLSLLHNRMLITGGKNTSIHLYEYDYNWTRLRISYFLKVEKISSPLLSKEVPPLNWYGLPLRTGHLERKGKRSEQERGKKKTLLIINHRLPSVLALVTTPIWNLPVPMLSIQLKKSWAFPLSQGLGRLWEKVIDRPKPFFFLKALTTKPLIYPIPNVKKTCQILSNNIFTIVFSPWQPCWTLPYVGWELG